MKNSRTSIAIALFATMAMGATSAFAETCQEKFIRIMTDRETKEPTKIHITQEIKGGMKSMNWNYQDGKGNWMTEMIDPQDAQWSMGYENILYSSADKGKTWQKIRDMGDQSEANQKSLEERAATVTNAVCGNEELDGVTHETVEADYKMLGSFEADIHDKFWVNPETGYVPKLETSMKGSGFESFTTQLVEPAPDLVMPKPE